MNLRWPGQNEPHRAPRASATVAGKLVSTSAAGTRTTQSRDAADAENAADAEMQQMPRWVYAAAQRSRFQSTAIDPAAPSRSQNLLFHPRAVTPLHATSGAKRAPRFKAELGRYHHGVTSP